MSLIKKDLPWLVTTLNKNTCRIIQISSVSTYQVHDEDNGREDKYESQKQFSRWRRHKGTQFWRVVKKCWVTVAFQNVVISVVLWRIRHPVGQRKFLRFLRMPQLSGSLWADGQGQPNGRKKADVLAGERHVVQTEQHGPAKYIVKYKWACKKNEKI